jgi:hypothetical protein
MVVASVLYLLGVVQTKKRRVLCVTQSVAQVISQEHLNVKELVRPDQEIRVSPVFKAFTPTYRVIDVVIHSENASTNANRAVKGFDIEELLATVNAYQVSNLDLVLLVLHFVTNPEIDIQEQVNRHR